MSEFKFKLNQYVEISVGTEAGFVVGRAEYVNKSPDYLIRLRALDGRQVDSWMPERVIQSR